MLVALIVFTHLAMLDRMVGLLSVAVGSLLLSSERFAVSRRALAHIRFLPVVVL